LARCSKERNLQLERRRTWPSTLSKTCFPCSTRQRAPVPTRTSPSPPLPVRGGRVAMGDARAALSCIRASFDSFLSRPALRGRGPQALARGYPRHSASALCITVLMNAITASPRHPASAAGAFLAPHRTGGSRRRARLIQAHPSRPIPSCGAAECFFDEGPAFALPQLRKWDMQCAARRAQRKGWSCAVCETGRAIRTQ